MCFNVDIFEGPSQTEEAQATYISKVQAIENLHHEHAPERMQHLVENGQWSWTHPSKPTNFVRDLPLCSYCALVKAKRSSFRGPITTPDQVGGLCFADVQGPFEVPSLEENVYKIGIIEAITRYIWMTMAESKKVYGMLEQWLKDTIPWMRAQRELKAFQIQTDNGEFSNRVPPARAKRAGIRMSPCI